MIFRQISITKVKSFPQNSKCILFDVSNNHVTMVTGLTITMNNRTIMLPPKFKFLDKAVMMKVCNILLPGIYSVVRTPTGSVPRNV